MVEMADIRKAYDDSDGQRTSLRAQVGEYFANLSPDDLVDVMEIIHQGRRKQFTELTKQVKTKLEQVDGGMALNIQQYTVIFLACDADRDAWKKVIALRKTEQMKTRRKS